MRSYHDQPFSPCPSAPAEVSVLLIPRTQPDALRHNLARHPALATWNIVSLVGVHTYPSATTQYNPWFSTVKHNACRIERVALSSHEPTGSWLGSGERTHTGQDQRRSCHGLRESLLDTTPHGCRVPDKMFTCQGRIGTGEHRRPAGRFFFFPTGGWGTDSLRWAGGPEQTQNKDR